MTVPVITVDGPSGSGKGTVSRAIARQLGWRMLDSGALYRLTALAAEDAGLDPDTDRQAIAALAARLQVEFLSDENNNEIIELNGRDVTQRVRAESTGDMASRCAVIPEVRASLVDLQHAFRRVPGLVADGRDMGTVIFPDAPLKIFLTASVAERTERRFKQLGELGISANIDRIYSEIAARDERDRTRSESPLVPAADAVELDSTGKPVQQVIAEVMDLVDQHGLKETA